ncbi:hypothetical protein BKP37_13110 [Anaerobacillus alkalilacustris]|uniref:histidine kinase n=1 Tax=Anaerobacillus alkalilacustris TaxID=393763 RepID=A0A1S2LLR4_9BACI|nr:histidine kinase [Anaerobacillus alkalilacustris]OIJ12375.1 hypothetical protein BKP37_13110 [Anaerobacillus alkalilacustris]
MKKTVQFIITSLKNKSVKTKILGITIGLVILMGLTSTIILREILVVKLSEDLDRRAISIASDVSSRSIDHIILRDIYSFHTLLQDTMSNNPDIEYIFIVDQNFEMIIHTFGSNFEVSDELLNVNMIDTNGDITNTQLVVFESETGKIHDVIAPIFSGDAGFVRVGLNEKQIYNTIDEITFLLVMATIIIGGLGFVIAFILTKYMYRDLTQLMHTTQQVGKGNLDCKVDIECKDEIGMLAKEINTMIERLNDKNEENNRFTKVLKMRNNELSLLHQLAVGSTDIAHFEKLLESTAERLIEELGLNSCFIEILLGGESLSTYKGSKWCTNCTSFEEKLVLDSKHFFIPFKTKGKKIGQILGCFENDPDDTTVKFLTSFARQLTVIAENAELWKEIKYKEELRLKLLDRVLTAQEEERKRIARELHDETSQSITSIIVGLTLLEEYDIPSSMQQEIIDLKEVSQRTLDEVHYLSWSLRPSVLDDLGLMPAIKKYVIEYMKKFTIDVDIQVIGFKQVRLSSIYEVTIYRVIQEALTNAARHANSDNISIILKHVNGVVSVIIEDDGEGFDVNKTLNGKLTKNHLGLKGMQERIESIGGKLVIESNTGIGTTVYMKDIMIGDETGGEAENNAS